MISIAYTKIETDTQHNRENIVWYTVVEGAANVLNFYQIHTRESNVEFAEINYASPSTTIHTVLGTIQVKYILFYFSCFPCFVVVVVAVTDFATTLEIKNVNKMRKTKM